MTDQEARLLLSPSAYDVPVRRVRMLQTHTSWVFLTGRFAYKVKKPVYFGFLDYTTIETRRFFCEEELRLNRRLSPDIYESVLPITDDGKGLKVGGQGLVVDYCVKMRELPQSAIMKPQLERGRVTYGMIGDLARVVAEFHARAETNTDIARFGELETVRFNWDENFAQTEQFCGQTMSRRMFVRIRQAVERYLRENASLFRDRVGQGRVRECHGDLHSRNIFLRPLAGHAASDDRLATDVKIFDCIEFNRRFSCCDVASEVAFLVMDLEYHGAKGLANYFVDRYLKLTGDWTILRLLEFYKCYRAYVRGKVVSFSLNDSGLTLPQRKVARVTAQRYFRLAQRYADSMYKRPVLILMMGLPGVGKTYLAERLAARLDCYHLRSDAVRKELMKVSLVRRPRSSVGNDDHGLDQGLYSPQVSRLTYDEMCARAQEYLKAGCRVILDATFARQEDRAAAYAVSRASGAETLTVECVCPRKVVLSRIRRRLRECSFSDADLAVYRHIKASFEPIRHTESSIKIDTTLSVARCLAKIEDALLRL